MAEKSILIVCAHYAPENAIGALRVTSLARHLAEHGWKTTVVTRCSRTPATADPGVTTLRVPDRVADWRRRTGQGSVGPVRRAARRLASGLSFRLSWPDEQIWWSISVWRALRDQARDGRVVLVSGPPFSGFLLGYLLARRGGQLILDYRDLWSRSTYHEGTALRRWLDARVERVVLRRAAGVATVSQPLADDMARWCPGTPVVVARNGFDPADYAAFDHGPASRSGRLRLIYMGELYAGKRDPQPLFEALSNEEGLRSEVSVEFYGSNVQTLRETVERLRLQDCVTLSPRVSHRDALDLQGAADVLLLLLWNDPREAGVYSGKLFEYLGARRAVLMLGYPDGVAADLVRCREVGVVANTAREIAVALQDFLARKRAGELTRPPARSAEGLSRGEQFAPLLDYVESLVPPASARHSRTNER